MSAQGKKNQQQAELLGVTNQRIGRWRTRWANCQEFLLKIEQGGATHSDLTARIIETLADEKRPGGPSKFSPEQIAQIIALACESPADSDLPISHWTLEALVQQATKRSIVKSISARQVGRFLAKPKLNLTSRSTG